MDAEEYRNALDRLGLTQAIVGKMFGVNERTSRRWAEPGAFIPTAVELMLNLMLKKRLKVQLEIPFSPERRAERRTWTFQAKQSISAME